MSWKSHILHHLTQDLLYFNIWQQDLVWFNKWHWIYFIHERMHLKTKQYINAWQHVILHNNPINFYCGCRPVQELLFSTGQKVKLKITDDGFKIWVILTEFTLKGWIVPAKTIRWTTESTKCNILLRKNTTKSFLI